MNKKLFAELVESMRQMTQIARRERAPSREVHVDAISIKALRSKLGGLSAEVRRDNALGYRR